MTKMLQTLIARLSALPDDEQDAAACQFLAELEDERAWDDLLRRSGPLLKTMAAKARGEREQRDTQDLGEFLKSRR
jgi:hypothetical protein